MNLWIIILIAVVVLLIILICAMGYVKAPPDMAYIISGFKKEPRILIGKAGIRIPFLERLDKLLLRQITVEDTMAADDVFSKLMGEEVEPRREFIEKNATYVENLDV